MTVTSVSKSWRGSSGSRSLQDKTYVVHYRVVTDDATDGVRRIIEHFEDTDDLPFLGDTYTYEGPGIVQDDGVALWKIEPARDMESGTSWDVALHYKTPDDPAKKDGGGGGGGGVDGVGETEEGEPTNDPLSFSGSVEISYQDFTRPVESGTYRSGMNAAVITNADGSTQQPSEQILGGPDTVGPLVNSALVPYNPPLERNATRIQLRYTKNLAEYPQQAAAQYHRAVNDDAVTFHFKREGLKFALYPYSAQCVAIDGAFTETNGVTFWRVTWTLIIDDEFGFRPRIVDRGLPARAMYGDPDGRGGFITSTEGDQLRWRRLTDKNGNPISEPVLLDGNGQPLVIADDGAPIEPVYLTYSIYRELPFWMIGIPVAAP